MLTLSDFNFELPADLIAQTPPEQRGRSRLLVATDGPPLDAQFPDLAQWLQPGDLLVFNDTKVIPARLFGRKPTGGQIEMLVERVLTDTTLLVQMRASHPPKPGSGAFDLVSPEDGQVHALASVVERRGQFTVVQLNVPALPLLQSIGRLPLPPYIERTPEANDMARYQTVYARVPGAVAAPTAGLHFSPEFLAQLSAQGIHLAYLTLHVGAGTFSPVRTENLAEHNMHSEWFEIPAATAQSVQEARARGNRVVAIGTTSLRALESAAQDIGLVQAGARETTIFITPGFQFRVVDQLVTNFHLPKSTLMMLVSAFAGTENIRQLYAHAIAQRYRFFSYGDAMLLTRRPPSSA
jgi:S-adenosylmethionine:tRNA ribosyltransferase-isomerase